MFAFNRDLNVVLARGVRRMFAIALEQYRRALEERSVLDFSDVLQRALELLRQMDEFSQSRFRLEARYHHVLVDEFQDTSRAQWELVSLLVKAWGEGLGLATSPRSSSSAIASSRSTGSATPRSPCCTRRPVHRGAAAGRPSPRASIARSFRAVPELLQFVNDAVRGDVAARTARRTSSPTTSADRFPVDP